MDRHYREIIKTEFGARLICESLVVELWEMATLMSTFKRYNGSGCRKWMLKWVWESMGFVQWMKSRGCLAGK
jgi:hypothetical protein